ncbi:CadD family cadmium resistance transporter [Alkalibacterium pelagium]|uniref:Cadmium resistance transporter (Or sequestration) family protein n=1 Tax=Alkalibacterium pelagium TaxID=426702 RepID=A0A1H7KH78_9LACT|nr:CadD family cadmium resistance transporter [Alkalibacterium pelagium]GEN50743.1 cadmium resistance protein CadD [Alkalibacterium pelagium]SEK86253.1 cadmium resistance transporter (or sequestration) family protein [Alkalibacterium pelagium]
MFQTLLTASGVYVSTSIDYLFILIIIFAQLDRSSRRGQVYAGQFLGTGILVGVSLIAAFIVSYIPEEWIIGLLGLIPIYLGIHFARVGEEDADEEAILDKMNQRQSSRLFWTVTLLTIASGGDNLGIYIPYFSTLTWSEVIIVLVVFSIGMIGLVEASRLLSDIPGVSETIEQYERFIIPVVFVTLGLYILIENGTLQTLFRFMF